MDANDSPMWNVLVVTVRAHGQALCSPIRLNGAQELPPNIDLAVKASVRASRQGIAALVDLCGRQPNPGGDITKEIRH